MINDLRYALRGLRASPAFAIAAILSLALGIGANTAIFSLINVAMLEELPAQHPEQLVRLTLSGGPRTKSPSAFSAAMWDEIRRRQDVFSSMLAYGSTGRGDLSAGGESRPIAVGLVSGGFFATLGTRPTAGRLLVESDDVAGCAPAAVLTHTFWMSEYGGDPGILGSTLAINGRAIPIVGITEQRFVGLGFGYYPPVWMAQCASTLIGAGGGWRGGVLVGRLKPGVTIAQAAARIRALAPAIVAASRPARMSADDAANWDAIKLGVEPFDKGFRFLEMDYGRALWVLMGIVTVVLLIACGNAANLLLARATARRHEFAVRVALGATRGVIIRQVVLESLLLSTIASLLGLALARWGSWALVTLISPQRRPAVLEIPLDTTVLAFTAGAAIATALLFGLGPAWRAAGVDPQAAMTGATRIVQGHSRWSVGKTLIVGQIALALAMVTGAGLLAGSWWALRTADPGFRAEGVLLVDANTRASGLSPRERGAAYRRALDELRLLPGVRVASAASRTPLGNSGWDARVERRGDGRDSVRGLTADLNEVSDRYFATVATAIIAGRDFDTRDTPGAAPVVVVNRWLATELFGSPAAAIGRRLTIAWDETNRLDYDVVGVAANSRDHAMQEAPQPLLYLPFGQDPEPEEVFTFAIRGDITPSLMNRVRATIMAVSPRFSLRTRTLREQVDESLRLPRTLGVLSGFFGALALILAALGLYGILAYNIGQRRNELGVRIAFGADARRIATLVLGDVGRILLPGIALGVLLSIVVGRLVGSFLYGVTPHDPLTLVIAAATLALVALAAATIPVRRATRVDPNQVLRV